MNDEIEFDSETIRIGVEDVFKMFDGSSAEDHQIEFRFSEPKPQQSEPIFTPSEHLDSGFTYETTSVELHKFAVTVDESDYLLQESNKVNCLLTVIAKNAVETLYDAADPFFVGADGRDRIIDNAYLRAYAETRVGFDKCIILVSQVLGESLVPYNTDTIEETERYLNDSDAEYQVVVDERNMLRGGDVIVADAEELGYAVVGQEFVVEEIFDDSVFSTRRNHVVTNESKVYVARFGNI